MDCLHGLLANCQTQSKESVRAMHIFGSVTHLVVLLVAVGVMLSKKAKGSVVSNHIGMKFGRIVFQVNMHRLTVRFSI